MTKNFKTMPIKLRALITVAAALLGLIGWPGPVSSQQTPITAGVNRTVIAGDELVVLTVTVVDDSAQQPRPILPRLDGMAVVDLDIATDVNLVNGQIHTEVIYTYQLQPRRTGLLTIPPVVVKIDDQNYKTAPISIQVNQGSAPAPSPDNAVAPKNVIPPADIGGQDFFIEAAVDLSTPYLGQQIIYTFRFFQALQIYRRPQFDTPLLAGFESMGMPVREFNLDAAGRTYLVTEIRTLLFPTHPGKAVIGPARLTLPGSGYEEPLELLTDPIEIEVKPLPNNAPPTFNGAVGQYQLEAQFSPQVAVVHQPSTLFVSVNGSGNIRDLPELVWPADISGWQAYNSLTSMTTAIENDRLTGTRVYERVMVPAAIGEFAIPPVSLVYFDPVAAEYRTLESGVITVKVIPPPTPDAALAAAAPPDPAPAAEIGSAANEPAVNVGALAWRELWGVVAGAAAAVFRWTAILVCGVLPVAAALGLGGRWVWLRRAELWEQARRAATAAETRLEPKPKPAPAPVTPSVPEPEPLQQPTQTIHPALAQAMKGNPDNFKAVSQALAAYLTQALQTSVNGLTRTEIALRLHRHAAPEALVGRIVACLEQSELGRYGPLTEDAGWSLLVETDDLLFALDKIFEAGTTTGHL